MISKDTDDLVYEMRLSTMTRCRNMPKIMPEVLKEFLRESGIKIMDKNNEYNEKIQYLNHATYRESITENYTYEIYDTIILEKK